ncbi:MAG: hypothetical protein SVR94_16910 [Pseudomonadota bacterium]|nr:hypothetical protein [Pseudomonadota bacterium]
MRIFTYESRTNLGTLIIILIAILISGCQPSETAIQTAMAETQIAMPTSTDTIVPTSTQTNTPEPTFTATEQPTSTPTFTATPDERIIEIGPEEFLLKKEDLPSDAKYYLPNYTWISPHRNSEIISGWGKEEGQRYLEETGRIDGWVVYYARGTSTVRAPEEISHNIIQYKTAEGSKIAMEMESPYSQVEYEIVDADYNLGDKTIISQYREMQPSGEYRVDYLVETAYRNYQSRVGGWGWEKEFDLDYVIQLAEIALEKLKVAPLVEP